MQVQKYRWIKTKRGRLNNIRLVAFILGTVFISGCSTYSTGFSCGDARGASCMSMDRVDRMIASGEIERFNIAKAKKDCRGRVCRKQVEELMWKDSLTSMPIHFIAKDEVK